MDITHFNQTLKSSIHSSKQDNNITVMKRLPFSKKINAEVEKVLIMYVISNYPTTQIAKLLKDKHNIILSMSTIDKWKKNNQDKIAELKKDAEISINFDIKKTFKNVVENNLKLALESQHNITPDKLEKSTAAQLATIGAICFDKYLLGTGQATEIILTKDKSDDELRKFILDGVQEAEIIQNNEDKSKEETGEILQLSQPNNI